MSGWTGGDEIVGGVLDICSTERITSAVFSGIDGCSEAQVLMQKRSMSDQHRLFQHRA